MTELSFTALLDVLSAGQLEIRTDSRRVERGDVFVAVRGATHDAAAFIPSALEAGASIIVCGADDADRVHESAACVIVHEDARAALWQMAQARYHTAALPFPVIGVTGTNGKTTTAFLLEHLLASQGKKSGVLGTVSYRWPGFYCDAPLTTPDSLELHRMLDAMRQAEVDAAVMEVSSHAIHQQRVGGVPFAGAIFTNLTQDHLDYHQDMESYFSTKAAMFLDLPATDKVCAVNSDDPYGQRLLRACKSGIAFGLGGGTCAGHAHLAGEISSSGREGLHLRMRFGGARWELRSPLVGAFNAMNLLGVQALWLGLGGSPDDLLCLESFTGVPGRLERIENPQDLHIFVDYAHTPDALINVLQALRAAGFARIVAVFGCGGDRDRAKRPLMGAAAAQYADVAVLTSDNPRREDPEAVMNDVLAGLKEARQLVLEPDRRTATRRALAMIGPEDALLVAGKGHEHYQIIGDTRYPYSDRQVIREFLGCA